MDKFTEVTEILAHLAPTAANAAVGDHNTDYVCMGDCHRAFVLIDVGEVAATATLDVEIWEATDVDGTGAQEIAEKAITQLSVTEEGELVGIEINSTDLDSDDYSFLQARTTVENDTFYFALIFLGFDLRYEPADVSIYSEVVG